MTSLIQGTQPSQKRLVSIQVCRGVAAMLVVFNHLRNVESKYFETHYLDVFQYGGCGVDLFFVISGVVISAVTLGKFRSASNARIFLQHRFARIYPVYWIYSFIVLIAYLYNPMLINAAMGHRVEIVRSFLLIPSHYSPLVLQGWTLSYEIYFYFAFGLLLLCATASAAPWLLACWASVIALFGAFKIVPPGPICSVLFSPLIFEFLAGCAIFHFCRRSRLHPGIGVVLIAASMGWLGLIIFNTDSAFMIEGFGLLRAGLYGSFAALFILGMVELERTESIRFARPLTLIGDWSYSIYLSHIFVVELLGRIIKRVMPHFHLAIFIESSISLPVVILLGYLSYRFFEVPLMEVLYKRKKSQTRAITI